VFVYVVEPEGWASIKPSKETWTPLIFFWSTYYHVPFILGSIIGSEILNALAQW
jgi:hypothetical protein